MSLSVADRWVEEPLRLFVDEARVRLAVLMETSGQVLGQFGFARSVDLMTACALSAAIHATSNELGRMVDGKPFAVLHHAGVDRQIFLGEVPAAGGTLLLLVVFDDGSSLGVVQLFFREFCARVTKAARPPAPGAEVPALKEDFERELNRNLAVMFGRA